MSPPNCFQPNMKMRSAQTQTGYGQKAAPGDFARSAGFIDPAVVRREWSRSQLPRERDEDGASGRRISAADEVSRLHGIGTKASAFLPRTSSLITTPCQRHEMGACAVRTQTVGTAMSGTPFEEGTRRETTAFTISRNE